MQQKALAYLKSLTEGQGVFLRFDPDVRAGSTITPAYVYRAEDGVFVNASLIDHGYARANQVDYYIHAEAFAKLEKKASRAGVGLWASLPKPKHTATHIEEQSRGTAAPGDDSGPSMDASDAAKGTFSPTTIKSSSDSDKKTKNSKEAKGADHP